MDVKWAPPKILDFFNELYMKLVTLKGEGPNQYIFWDLPLNEVFDMYTQNLSNLYGGVMDN